jgi:hypothetical protein
MVKKALLLIIAGYFVSIIQSCCTDEYKCKWTGFEIQVLDNSGKEPVIRDGNNINKKSLGFRISMTDSILYTAQKFNMVAECLATKCGVKLERLHSITSIVIITIYDYSKNLPAGSDITHLFKARIAENVKEDYKTINDVILQINDPNNNSYSEKTKKFDLYLMDNMCIGGQQNFEINVFLSDGKVLVKQTNDILLR